MAQTMSATDIDAEAQRQQHHGPARDRGGAGMHQQHAAGEQHDAVERDVALRQHVSQQVRLVGRRGRGRDHAVPEEAAEAEQQDHRVQAEPGPLHADGGGPDDRQRGGEHQRIERDEEHVADGREGVDAEQPVRGVQQVAGAVAGERGGEEPPGAARGRVGRAAGGRGGEHCRDDRRRGVGIEVDDLERAGSLRIDEGQQDRHHGVGEQGDDGGAGPAGDEPLALPALVGVRPWRHLSRRAAPAR